MTRARTAVQGATRAGTTRAVAIRLGRRSRPVVAMASFVGLVLYTLLPNGPTLVHLLDAFSGVVLVGALGGLALNLRLGDLFDEELILLVISATALLVTGTLSGRINRGKTIVGHRA